MSYRPRYMSGDYKAICDFCGKVFPASRLRETWEGFMVCSKDWEQRHDQEYVTGVRDQNPPPWTRPEQPDTFIDGPNLYFESGYINRYGVDNDDHDAGFNQSASDYPDVNNIPSEMYVWDYNDPPAVTYNKPF